MCVCLCVRVRIRSLSQVELHGINIKVVLSTEVAKAKAAGEVAIPRHLNVSKASTVRELKETILQQCNVVGLDVRLWDYFNKQPYALLDTPSKTLTDCQVNRGMCQENFQFR